MKKMFDSWGSHVKKIPLQGLLCLFILCLSLPLHAQNEEGKININVKDASVKEVLEVLKKYNYRLVYSTAVIDACKKKITLDMKKVTPSQVLDEIFKETNLVYKIEGNLITIKEVKKDELLVAQGVVKDENGEPIPGVSVLIKGTVTGTATDNKGNFSLKVNKNSALIFSFLGMETKTVFVESEKPIQVVMREMNNEMDEVVVTGYQIIKKRESTSSIVSLKAEDIIEPVGTSLDQMLQGKVPGMSVMQMTSTVGAAPKIRIRGSSTIIGNREPVWVLDGVVLQDPVPLDATELNSMDRVNLIGNAISGLNPEDIERIDVLKDASSTALYGTKAANGVIVITTKRGKRGTPSIRYSTSMSFIGRPCYDDLFLMNSRERIEVSEEIYKRGLQFVGFSPTNAGFEGALYQLYNGMIDQKQFNQEVQEMKEINTDWFDLLFRNSFSQQHTFSLSGANDRVDYYFSAGYANQQGSSLKENSERFSFMSNLGFKISDKFRAAVMLGASVSTTNRPTVDLFEYAYNTSRVIPAYNADGSWFFYDYSAGVMDGPTLTIPLVYNVFNELHYSGSKNKIKSINTNINLDYKFTSWLSASAVLSYNSSASESEMWYDERTYKVATYRKLPYGFDRKQLTNLSNYMNNVCELPFGGILNSSFNGGDSFTARVSFNINKSFNEVHSLSLLGGLDLQSQKSTGISEEIWGYLPERGKNFVSLDKLDEWPNAARRMLQMKPTIIDATNNSIAYYASFSYAYKGKYVMSANIRGEGSNKLGEQARFLPIWSFSGRWNVTDENFMDPLLNVLSDLAIRASYGIQANVTEAHNPNMIISVGSLDSKSEEYYATLNSLPNEGLKWEKTNSFNIGVDFDLFKGKLSGSFEYFHKKSKDQLLPLQVTSTNGEKMVTINGGDLTNKGWDLSLALTPIKTEDFEWRVSFNTSKVYNEVSTTAEQSVTYEQYLNGSLVRAGYALNTFYSYRFGGLDNKGIPIFLGLEDHDEEGNVIITNQEEALRSALVCSGKREPDLSGGLSMGFQYKNFSINSTFSFQFGSKIRLNELYQGDDFKLPYPGQNMSSDFVKRWRKPGDEKYTNIPALTDELYTVRGVYTGGENPINKTDIMNNVSSNYWQMYNNADMRVVSGNFLRCNSISLSYSFNSDFVKKLYLKSLSLSLGVSNPFVIKAKGLQGRDPEQLTLGSGTIPPQQTYSFSMNVTF